MLTQMGAGLSIAFSSNRELIPAVVRGEPSSVMAGLVPAIHVFAASAD
jgi:hypothetical protein